MVPLLVDAYNSAEHRRNPDVPILTTFLVRLVLFLVVTIAAWSVGRAAAIARTRAEEQKEAWAAAAIRDERLRLACELHDIVSHGISLMVLQSAAVRTQLSDNQTQLDTILGQVESSGVQSMDELRRMLGILRPGGATSSELNRDSPSMKDIPQLIERIRPSVNDL